MTANDRKIIEQKNHYLQIELLVADRFPSLERLVLSGFPIGKAIEAEGD
jgi:hypothetical protein